MTIEFENTLRKLILQILKEDLTLYKVTEERIENWKQKQETENKKYKGILLEKRLLYYSDFYDLKNIILKNWESFKPVLDDKKRFEIFFTEIEKFRNTLSHGRTLTQSQEYLLKGITADLKNMITIYHNKNEMKEDFFVKINSVSDNLGHTWPGNQHKPVLRVGDYYELIVDANDPKDREIEFQLVTFKGVFMKFQKSNRFSFTVDNAFVGVDTSLIIEIKTPNSEYENKDGTVIHVMVLPE